MNMLPSIALGFTSHLLYFFNSLYIRSAVNQVDDYIGFQRLIDSWIEPRHCHRIERQNASVAPSTSSRYTSATLLALTKEYGFSEPVARQALEKSKGNMNEALNLLLDQQLTETS
jgi:hypothetical protein